MKRILFIAILLILGSIALQSCVYDTSNSDAATIIWIKSATKPIICVKSLFNNNAQRIYTLVDSAGIVYKTNWTNLTLPDTIK